MLSQAKILPAGLPIFLILLLLAGCGQKGPLFLPGDPSQIQTDIPEQGENTGQQEDDEPDDNDDDQ